MKIENLRSAYRAKPFRPFSIHTGSGQSYLITHPETIAFSSDGNVVVFFPTPSEVGMVDVAGITEIITHPSS